MIKMIKIIFQDGDHYVYANKNGSNKLIIGLIDIIHKIFNSQKSES